MLRLVAAFPVDACNTPGGN